MADVKKRPATSDGDLTDSELEAIQQKVDDDIEKNGMPMDAELREEIENLNVTQQEPIPAANAWPSDGKKR